MCLAMLDIVHYFWQKDVVVSRLNYTNNGLVSFKLWQQPFCGPSWILKLACQMITDPVFFLISLHFISPFSSYKDDTPSQYSQHTMLSSPSLASPLSSPIPNTLSLTEPSSNPSQPLSCILASSIFSMQLGAAFKKIALLGGEERKGMRQMRLDVERMKDSEEVRKRWWDIARYVNFKGGI